MGYSTPSTATGGLTSTGGNPASIGSRNLGIVEMPNEKLSGFTATATQTLDDLCKRIGSTAPTSVDNVPLVEVMQ